VHLIYGIETHGNTHTKYLENRGMAQLGFEKVVTRNYTVSQKNGAFLFLS